MNKRSESKIQSICIILFMVFLALLIIGRVFCIKELIYVSLGMGFSISMISATLNLYK